MAEPEFGDWVIMKVEGAQGLAVFRLRRDRPLDADGHPIKITIAWPYEGDERGLPTQPTLTAMDASEVAIDELTLQSGLSYLMLVTTGFNLRHYTFYAASFEAFIARFNALLQQPPRLPIEITYAEDRDWQAWRSVRDRT